MKTDRDLADDGSSAGIELLVCDDPPRERERERDQHTPSKNLFSGSVISPHIGQSRMDLKNFETESQGEDHRSLNEIADASTMEMSSDCKGMIEIDLSETPQQRGIKTEIVEQGQVPSRGGGRRREEEEARRGKKKEGGNIAIRPRQLSE